MNNFSLEFFKSLVERDQAIVDMLTKQSGSDVDVDKGKPYSSIKFVNDVLTIILNDGNIISKHPATITDFQLARGAAWEEELFVICSSSEGLEEKRKFEEKLDATKR